MAALGLILIWVGYTTGILGYSKIKSANGATALSISDVALPSHRALYMQVAATWATSNSQGINPNAPYSAQGPSGQTVSTGGTTGTGGLTQTVPNKPGKGGTTSVPPQGLGTGLGVGQ